MSSDNAQISAEKQQLRIEELETRMAFLEEIVDTLNNQLSSVTLFRSTLSRQIER